MGSKNTDMSYQIEHDKSATAKSIAFSLLRSQFISCSVSALNEWSTVKSNGAKVAAKIDQFVCRELLFAPVPFVDQLEVADLESLFVAF
jgi:hypothetical protein